MLFILKKFVANLVFPLPLAVWFLAAGIMLLLATRRQTAAKILLVTGFLILAGTSYRVVADAIVGPLEAKYPAVTTTDSSRLSETFRGVKWVVVLGGGHSRDERLPVSSQISPASLVRLVEGIRLQRMIPGSRLLLSGGGVYDTSSDASVMKEMACALGVGPGEITLESESKDTDDQARLLQPVLRREPFVLVTSASHMRRSVDLFAKLGMRAIPAPTDFLVREVPALTPSAFYPTPEALGKTERAVYEQLGEWWAALRGKV